MTSPAKPATIMRTLDATEPAASLNDPGRLASELAVYALGVGKLVVRVFDEPEAHLHPAAQRRLVTALDKLEREDTGAVALSDLQDRWP
jgi:hypothetical protein